MMAAELTTASFLDERPLSWLQIRTLVLCGLVAVVDGNDTQAMGIGAPSIAAVLHVDPSAMGWALSGSWMGAAAGAVICGGIADRIGRKSVLIACVLIFGAFTMLTPLSASLPLLVACRVLAGIGLGGATPCFIALSSEYIPARMRGSLVSLVWAAFPLGLLLGGLLNGWLLTWLPWTWVFYVGGALPLGLSVILAAVLPESIGFLLVRRPADSRTSRIVGKIAPGIATAAAAAMRTGSVSRPGIAELLRGGRSSATLCDWLLLFTCFGTTAAMLWVPTILRQHGVSLSAAAVASSSLGFGALLGIAVAGTLVDRFGAARALVGPVLLGAAAAALSGFGAGSAVAMSISMALVGALVGLGASGGIALIPLIYPVAMRSTGAGWSMGFGRLGQVIVPAAFAVLLARHWDAVSIFLALGTMPLIGAFAALGLNYAVRQPRPNFQTDSRSGSRELTAPALDTALNVQQVSS